MAWVALTVLMVVAGQDQTQPPAQVAPAATTASQAKAPPDLERNRPVVTTKKPTTNKATTPRRAAETDVRIRSRAEMEKPKSPFLLAPGASSQDRYGPDGPVDWSDVPPWRQSSFFGIRARGLFFVYVVDCSGSMIDDDRMPRATIELRRSVFALREPQRFEVIFYNNESIPMPGGPIPRSADLKAKNQLTAFLRLIDPDGGTDPRLAMRQALALRPDAVFLLSDGAFPEGTVEDITRANKHKIPIHCVDLTAGLAGDHLKRIAEANGGQYAARMGDLQGRP